MFYRMRTYRGVPEHAQVFDDFFVSRLLPVQLRHGARLVGRWRTEDDRVVAIWEYDSMDDYRRVDGDIRSDPDSLAAQQYRQESLPVMYTDVEEVVMTSTTELIR